MRRTNQAGIDLIKSFEGLRLTAYRCPAGIWTIGYGHTGHDVHNGLTISEDRAEALLRDDLHKFERGVDSLLEGAPTTDNQFAAMVSLSYNIGLGAFGRSTVLRTHKAGEYETAGDAFLMWVKAGGKVLKGLVNRRTAERELYNA